MTITILPQTHGKCKINQPYYDFSQSVLNAECFRGLSICQTQEDFPDIFKDMLGNRVQLIIGSPCSQEFLTQAAMANYQYVYAVVPGLTDPSYLEPAPAVDIYTGGSPLSLHIDQYPNTYRLSYSTATQWDMLFKICQRYSWVHITTVFNSSDSAMYSTNNGT